LVFTAFLLDVQHKKKNSVKLGRQVRLLCYWARHLTGLPLPLSGKTDTILKGGSLTRRVSLSGKTGTILKSGSLIRRAKRSLRYLLIEGP